MSYLSSYVSWDISIAINNSYQKEQARTIKNFYIENTSNNDNYNQYIATKNIKFIKLLY